MSALRNLLRTRLWASVVLVGVAAACAGCAGSAEAPQVASLRGVDDGGTRSSGTGGGGGDARTEELSTEQALIKLSRCLRKEGLDVPDPKVDAEGNIQLLFGQDVGFDPSSAKAQAAFDVCRPFIEGIVQSFSPNDIVELRDTLVDYAACVRKNGYDLPDPNFFNREGPFGKVDFDNPRFKRADAACRPVLERIQEVIN